MFRIFTLLAACLFTSVTAIAQQAIGQPLLLGLVWKMALDGDLPEDLPPELKAAAAKLPWVDPDELDRYVEDCRQGRLYDAVVKTSGVPRLLVKLAWMRSGMTHPTMRCI